MTKDEIMNAEQAYIIVHDVQDFFVGMSPHKIRCRIRSGLIPVDHLQDGKRLFIDRNSFIDFMKWRKEHGNSTDY